MARQVEVRVLVNIPDNVHFTDAELREWLHFEFRSRNELSLSNPGNLIPEPDVVYGSMTYRDYTSKTIRKVLDDNREILLGAWR